MKKIIILFFVLFLQCIVVFAMNVDYSDGEFKMNTNITRSGNIIHLQYNVSNLSSLKSVNGVSQAKLDAVSSIDDVQMDAVVDCSTNKMKVKNINMSGTNNKYKSSTDWIEIPADSTAQIQELCSTVK